MKSEIEVTQSCPTPSDPMDCSLPGSSVHGIFQARVLEWGAIALRTGKGLLKYMKIPESQNLEIKSRTQNYMEATIPQKYFHISR